MYLTHLHLSDFRNFASLIFDVPRGPVLLVGANGAGKTSLLEAIYYLATMTSFRASSDRQLISFLQHGKAETAPQKAVVTAEYYCKGRRNTLGVELNLVSNGNGSSRLQKRVVLNRKTLKVSEAIGKCTAVLFLPQMINVIEGPPQERRRYLNLILAQVMGESYANALAKYTKALSQRNALLKQIHERQADRAQLPYWNEKLAESGAQLIHARIEVVFNLHRLAAGIHHKLTRNGGALNLEYQPSYDPLPQPPGQHSFELYSPVNPEAISLDQIRAGFLERLAKHQRADIAAGVTTVGPHRDELRFSDNQIDLGTYGSRGQIRTAMLSLKMAEIAWMKEKTGESPVLLLDEVLAELDPIRRADLLNHLETCEQSLLTTTDLNLFSPEFIRKATLLQLREGRVEPMEMP